MTNCITVMSTTIVLPTNTLRRVIDNSSACMVEFHSVYKNELA